MKQLLITIAALVLVGFGESQESANTPEAEPVEPLAEAAKPETPTVKAPDISIHRAVEKGNIEAVKQHLAAGTDVNESDGILTPLHYANTKEIAELLIAKGANVNAKDKTGSPPLHRAVRKGQEDIVELLIAAGADVSVKWKRSEDNLLHAAASRGRTDIVKLLIANGLDVNAKNANESTPLHQVGHFGHTEVTKLLIEKGADVNAKTKLGLTTLHEAALRGHKELALLLIEKGADLNMKTEADVSLTPSHRSKGGYTPLDVAVLKNEQEIVDLLRKHGAKTSEELKATGN